MRKPKLHEHDGRWQTMAEWAAEAGVTVLAIYHRMRTYNLSLSQAIERGEKRAARYNAKTVLECEGIAQPIAEHALDYGIPVRLIVQRLKYGWDIERAITTPMQLRRPRKQAANDNAPGGGSRPEANELRPASGLTRVTEAK